MSTEHSGTGPCAASKLLRRRHHAIVSVETTGTNSAVLPVYCCNHGGEIYASGAFGQAAWRLAETLQTRGWRKLYKRAVEPGLNSMAVSQNGKRIVVVCGNILFLHDLHPGRANRYQFDQGGDIFCVAFSPDDKTFAHGAWAGAGPDVKESGTLTLRNTETGKIIWHRAAAHISNVWTLDFSPDGAKIATGCWDGTIKLWEAKTGKLLKTLRSNESGVYSVRFSPDGKSLAAGNKDSSVRIWDVRNGKEIETLNGHANDVHAVSFSPDGRMLASGGADKTIRLWDLDTAKLIHLLAGHEQPVSCLTFSPNGEILASASDMEGGSINLWNSRDGTFIRTLQAQDDPARRKPLGVRSLNFAGEGKVLISGSKNGDIRFWDVESGMPVQTLETKIQSKFFMFEP